ncbi:MAG: hypothetical protein BRC22_02450 [Parcubacteria group bacterium QH_9_35_7]|nr:MAG: hypothetical protein BRC22_02450 [Parcubacteria group bacterium QH_9_35_7]
MKLKSRIESLLFVNSDPLSFEKITEITGASKKKVKKTAENLLTEYSESDRGMNIVKKDQQLQMVTEEIRGVNCTRILRNLMMRGLIEEQEKKDRLVPEYVLSTRALQHLGISSTEELPDYKELNSDEVLEELLTSQD